MRRLVAALVVLIASIVIHFVLLAVWKDAVTTLYEQPRYLLSLLGMTGAGAWVFNRAGWGWFAALFVSLAVQLLADGLLFLFIIWLLRDVH